MAVEFDSSLEGVDWAQAKVDLAGASLGFGPQPDFMSIVVGRWLDNDANR